MKKLLLFISLVVFQVTIIPTFAQTQLNCTNLWDQARVWNFGKNAGLDFNYDPPIPLTNSALNIDEGCASICNVNGNLLFYTDGNNIWNGTSNSIVTSGLLGSYSSSTSASILPTPGNTNRYYIFTTDAFAWGYLYYSIVDSTGAIVNPVSLNKNIKLDTSEIVSEKLTAVRHSNSVDFWVISHEAHTDKFLIYLVDTSGITISSKPAIGAAYSASSWNQCPGVAKASCDGQKIAVATFAGHTVETYDFNRTLGILSNLHTISFSGLPYGLEFSPNKQFLYVGLEADSGSTNLAQINLTSDNIVPLWTATPPDIYRNGIQLGPDGKIYVTRSDTPFLGIITNPDSAGTACNYIDNGISLDGKICAAGLPNICWITGCCYCLSDTTNDLLCGDVYVPNAFSPNDDGKNDIFYVRGNCIKTMTLAIYDRWGEKVFESNDPKSGWNGKLHNKYCNTGVFVWYLDATLNDGTHVLKKGNLTLFR